MSEPPPPGVAGDLAGRDETPLTPETVESILADFRSWLTQMTPSAAVAGGPSPEAASAAAELVDLHTLLGQFIALRHEVNLQTRAVRTQQEQSAETLKQLSQALQTLRQTQSTGEPRGPTGAEDQVRPLLKTLLDLHDVLALAQREINRVSESLLPNLDDLANVPADEPSPRRSFLARWFWAGKSAPGRRESRRTAEHIREVLGSLLTGYTMSLQRLERALQQQGLEPIACVGQAFDPEIMEVVDVVADGGRAGLVVDEVRRGYLWRGRVFRYAQVKVAKG